MRKHAISICRRAATARSIRCARAARLQSQLQDTSRKLENLTDIERQLSSRKQLQGEIPTTAQARKGRIRR